MQTLISFRNQNEDKLVQEITEANTLAIASVLFNEVLLHFNKPAPNGEKSTNKVFVEVYETVVAVKIRNKRDAVCIFELLFEHCEDADDLKQEVVGLCKFLNFEVDVSA